MKYHTPSFSQPHWPIERYAERVIGRAATGLAIATILTAPVASQAQSAQSSMSTVPPAILRITISVPAPARVGFPIWVHTDLKDRALAVRYPHGDDPRYFGSNQLELRRDGTPVAEIPGFTMHALVGAVAGSIAPASSPRNRLPLHLGFDIDRPGRYSVRWTVIQGRASPWHTGPVLAQSEWLDFDVVAAPADARELWLTGLLASFPSDAGHYVGDFLPSILAAADDSRVARAVVDATYSDTSVISSCALKALDLIPPAVVLPLTMDTLNSRGPNDRLAYFISWHAHWFQDHRADIVRIASSFLTSKDDAIVIGALRTLSFASHFDWLDDTPLREARRELKERAPALIERTDSVAHALALALGGTFDPDVRDLLNQIISRHRHASEQARIALSWIDNPKNSRSSYRSASAAINAALTDFQSTDASRRRTGARTLIALGQDAKQAGTILGFLVEHVIRTPADVSAEAWHNAALVLARLHWSAPGLLTLYLERDGAVAALIEFGEPAVPAVTETLSLGGPARRRLAAVVLSAIGGTAAQAALRAALNAESDASIRRSIEIALTRLGQRPPRADFK